MHVERRITVVQEWTVIAMVIASAIAFWTAAVDVVSLPKLTVIFIGGAVLVVAEAVRVAVTGRVVVTSGPFTAVAAVFVVGLLLAAFVSGRPSESLLGAYQRYGGLLPYLVYVAVAFAVIRLHRDKLPLSVAVAFVAAGGLVAAYGLAQQLEIDPVPWVNQYGDALFSSLGNPNFAAGYLGITLPLMVWGALRAEWEPWLRAGSALLAGLTAVAILRTESVQGIGAGAAGLLVLLLAWVRLREGRAARIGVAGWVLAVTFGALVVVAGFTGRGPLDRLSGERTFEIRLWYWEAAAEMLADHPVLGVGLDRYGVHYSEYRPVAAATEFTLATTNDNPHNVPLAMFANGGLVLGLSYLTLMGITAWALLRGLLRLRGGELLLLGGIGGAWVAYQAQSLLSIDVPALALANWVLAGSVVAISWRPGVVSIRLPWAAAEPAPPRATRRRGRPRNRRVQEAERRRERVAWIVGAAVLLIAAWFGTRPLRADMAYADSRQRQAAGDLPAALDAAELATRRGPWEPSYWFQKGAVLWSMGQQDDALEAFDAALDRSPRGLGPLVTSARFANEAGRTDEAFERYQQALDVEPQHPELLAEAAGFYVRSGRPERAVELLERAVAASPGRPDLLLLLGAALGEAGDEQRARAVLERALELAPGHPEITQALEDLRRAG